jgi:hypothetical protein
MNRSIWLVADRNGKHGEAVRVTNITNYLIAPPKAYYMNNFTVMGWVKFNENLANQAFIDFSVGHAYKNALRFFLKEHTMQPSFQLDTSFVTSPSSLSLHKWYHLAFTVEGVQARMYVNGAIVAEKELLAVPRNLWRDLGNYVGKSHMAGRNVSNADFDEIKFFSRGLSKDELLIEVNG